MKTSDLYWFAGLLEGEGCITVYERERGRKPYITITIEMTDEDIVERVYHIFRQGSFYGPLNRNRKNRKSYWLWKSSNQKFVSSLLMTIYPLMGERRQLKIREALDIWRTVPYRSGRNSW